MRAEWDKKPEVFGKMRICDGCGKEFMPAVFHQYVDYTKSKNIRSRSKNKTGIDGRRKLYFCSYSCYSNRKKPIETQVGKGIQVFTLDGEFLTEFPNAQHAALWLAEQGYPADNRAIQRCCRGEVTRYHDYIFKYKEI